MNISYRKAAILGAIFLACAGVFLIIPGGSSPERDGVTAREAAAKPGTTGHPRGVVGEARIESEEQESVETMSRTRSRVRPVETEFDRLRREKHRLTDQMQILERAGFGERHPSRVKVAGELSKIDAELSATGGGSHTDP